MKKCLALLALLIFATTGYAQQGKYVGSAAARLKQWVDASNEQGYKLQNDGFSIGGGWIKQSKEWVSLYTTELKAGKGYRFIAVGDMDARDVDLQIVDSRGRVVANDSLTEPEAIVNFRPQNTDRYTVRIRLYASNQNLPSVCIAIVMVK